MKPTAAKLGILIQCSILTTALSARASTISLEPSSVQSVPGDLVRVNVFVDNAADLVSMGVKVSFDPAVVQAEAASQYEDVAGGWLRDADGDPATTGDQFANPPVEIDNVAGTVVMTGAHMAGPGATGLNGKILLGWVDFRAVAVGSAALNVDLGKMHPNDPAEKYDNFVTAQGSVDEPANIPGSLGIIAVEPDSDGDGVPDSLDVCPGGDDNIDADGDTVPNDCDNCVEVANGPNDTATAGASQRDTNADGYGNMCDADLNNDNIVNLQDLGLFKAAYGSADPDSDFNGNGSVNLLDLGIFKSLYGKAPGPKGALVP